MNSSRPNAAALVCAMVVPLVLAVFGGGGVLVVAGGVSHFFEMMQMGGPIMLLLLPLALMAAVFVGVFGLIGGRGTKFPAPVIVALTTAPAAFGLLGTLVGMSRVGSALEYAEPSMRAALLAAGIAEASTTRFLGMWWTGLVGLGAAFSLAFGALARRAQNTAGAGALIGLGTGSIVVVFGVVGAVLAPHFDAMHAVVVVYAVLAAGALLVAGRAAGSDEPSDRAAAFASAAPIAAAVGFFGTTSALVTSGQIKMFGVLAMVAPDERGRLVLAGARELQSLDNVADYAALVWLVPILVIAGYATLRSERARWGAVGVSLAIGALPILMSFGVDGFVRSVMTSASGSPFEAVADFHPVENEGASDESFNAVVRADGDLASVLAAASDLGTDRSLTVAIDRRATARMVNAVVREATNKDARELVLVGIGRGALSPEQEAELVEIAPMFALFSPSVRGVRAELTPAVANTELASDPELLEAVVRADGVVLKDRTGMELSLEREYADAFVWTRIDDGATATAIYAGLARMSRSRLRPILATEPRPAPPPKLEPLESPAMGSLPKKDIQRVIRRAVPRVKYCYERHLAKSPNLAGKITIAFVIDRRGRVRKATAQESSMNAPQVSACISRVMKTLRFPKPKGGEVRVRYPFVFRAQ